MPADSVAAHHRPAATLSPTHLRGHGARVEPTAQQHGPGNIVASATVEVR